MHFKTSLVEETPISDFRKELGICPNRISWTPSLQEELETQKLKKGCFFAFAISSEHFIFLENVFFIGIFTRRKQNKILTFFNNLGGLLKKRSARIFAYISSVTCDCFETVQFWHTGFEFQIPCIIFRMLLTSPLLPNDPLYRTSRAMHSW